MQIRTIAMDFWASLEHQLKYKQDVPDSAQIQQELRECADIISQTDARMLDIKNKIFQEDGFGSPVEKLKKLNLPLAPPPARP